MSEKVYDNPMDYKGEEWTDLLQAFNAHDIKLTLKSAYRKEGRKVVGIVSQKAASAEAHGSALRHGAEIGKTARVYAYSGGGGFLVSVKPRGRRGAQYTNSAGATKPVAWWADQGTRYRMAKYKNTKGVEKVRRGKMPSYHFMDAATPEAYEMVEKDIKVEIEDSVMKRAKKNGWT